MAEISSLCSGSDFKAGYEVDITEPGSRVWTSLAHLDYLARPALGLRCHLRFMVSLHDDTQTVTMAGGAIGLRRHHYRFHCHRVCVSRHGRKRSEMAATQLQLETSGSSPQSGRGDRKLGAASGRTPWATSGWLWQTQWPIPPRPSPQSCH